MSQSMAWVVGGGGLLGRHLLAALSADAAAPIVWRPGPTGIPWQDPTLGPAALENLVEAFGQEVRARGVPWTVFWCAGAGVVGTCSQDLELECVHLARTLAALERVFGSTRGAVVLASSAGGVYGNSPDLPLTESSPCLPVSEYGRSKLRQEAMVQAFAASTQGVSCLVARISNLFGPGQRMDKPQGLITQLSRSFYHRKPLRIYVPLDSQRDYLFAQDCARGLVLGLGRLGLRGRENVVKIFHSGRATSISGLLGIFNRMTRGHLRVICASAPTTLLQPRRLHFRSTVWPDLAPERPVGLLQGMQCTHLRMQELYCQGAMPPMP